MTFLLLLFALISLASHAESQQPHITIVVVAHNAKQTYKQCLDSILPQTYPSCELLWIDDASDDGSAKLIEKYIHAYNQKKQKKKLRFTHSKQQLGWVHHLYNVCHACDDETIIIPMEATDYFSSPDALKKIAHVYSQNNAWATYGQSVTQTGSLCCTHKTRNILLHAPQVPRSELCLHPFTFYAWLFKQIDCADLLVERDPAKVSTFYKHADHLSYIYPITNLADSHFQFVSDLLLVHHRARRSKEEKKHYWIEHQEIWDKALNYHAAYQPTALKECHAVDVLVIFEGNHTKLKTLLESIATHISDIGTIYILDGIPQSTPEQQAYTSTVPVRTIWITSNASNNHPLEQLKQALITTSADHIVVTTESYKVGTPIDIQHYAHYQTQTHAPIMYLMKPPHGGFFLSRSHKQYSPTQWIADDIYACKFGSSKLQKEEINTYAMVLVSKQSVLNTVKSCSGNIHDAPTDALKRAWLQRTVNPRKIGLISNAVSIDAHA